MTFLLAFMALGLALIDIVDDSTDDAKSDYLASFPLYAAIFLVLNMIASFVFIISIGVLTPY